MAIEAELADGTVLEFPDGTPQGIVQATVKRMVLGAPSVQPAQKRGLIGRGLDVLRESAESILEPAATIASGAVAMPVAGAAMLAGDIYSGITGGPRIGEDVAADVMKAMTYQPRSKSAQSNLEFIGQAFQASKLPVAPQVTGGLSGAALSRLAGPSARQVGSIAAEEAAIAAQMLPDVGGKMQLGAQNLMLSALKPTTKQYASGAAELAAKELLKRDVSPNTKGVTAINQRIAELQGEISAAVKNSPAIIKKQAVIDRLTSVRDRFVRTANPESDLSAIAAAEEGFASHPLIPGETLPVQLAQDIKQGTYTELRKKYGELGSAQTESQKALARGLKEEIAATVPEVAPLNAEESALLKTLDVVERRQFLEMNKDPIPLTGALRNPAAWAAITADKSTAFKALVARLLYKTGKAIKRETPTPVAVPPAPTSTLPIPFESSRPTAASMLSLAREPEGIPYAPFAQEYHAQKAMESGRPDTFIQRVQAENTARQVAAEQAAERASQASRLPASGERMFTLEPSGTLRPEVGLRGATPAVVESTGNNLSSAVDKISSGKSFALSAEEKLAWNKSKTDLAQAAPELRGLSDAAIADKIANRAWVDNRVKELKTEYATWAKEVAMRHRAERATALNEMANTPSIMSAAERATAKQMKGEASRRLQLMIDQRKAEMQSKIDYLENLSDQASGRSTRGGIYLGQGPKTRAAQRGMFDQEQ